MYDKKAMCLFWIFVLIVATGSLAGAQIITSASGRLSRFAVKVIDNNIATSTITFESVPEVATEISLEVASPVLIRFCADCGVNTEVFDWGQLNIRATLDGIPIDPSPAASPTIAWSSNGNSDNGLLRAHCFD